MLLLIEIRNNDFLSSPLSPFYPCILLDVCVCAGLWGITFPVEDSRLFFATTVDILRRYFGFSPLADSANVTRAAASTRHNGITIFDGI